MTSFTDIEKQVLSHVEYGEDMRPFRDWSVMLTVAAILFIVSVLWNGWLYVLVVNGEAFGSPVVTPAAVDTNAIDAADVVFQKRATEESNYRTTYHFVDPSK